MKNDELRLKILGVLKHHAKIDPKSLAEMLDLSEIDVVNEIQAMEKEKVIEGYETLIDWDKTSKEVTTALIELSVAPKENLGFEDIARRIASFEEVESISLMSGGFDFMVLIEGRTMKEVAYFVAERLATLESVQATKTHFVLKKYKDHGVLLGGDQDDERMKISF